MSSSLRPARSSTVRTAGTGRMPMKRGSTPGMPIGDEPAERVARVPFGEILIGEDDRRCGVVDAGGVARGDRALPGKGWPQPGQVVGGLAGTDVLVGVDDHGPLLGGH